MNEINHRGRQAADLDLITFMCTYSGGGYPGSQTRPERLLNNTAHSNLNE